MIQYQIVNSIIVNTMSVTYVLTPPEQQQQQQYHVPQAVPVAAATVPTPICSHALTNNERAKSKMFSAMMLVNICKN